MRDGRSLWSGFWVRVDCCFTLFTVFFLEIKPPGADPGPRVRRRLLLGLAHLLVLLAEEEEPTLLLLRGLPLLEALAKQ